jgi:two-component system, NarL family, response regulator LiaR
LIDATKVVLYCYCSFISHFWVAMSLSDAQSLRILIVEDDPLMQLGLQHALSRYPNFEVVGQEDAGDAGVKSVLTLKPDIVIMDIGLPRLNGITATQQIKAACPTIRIVVLTSHSTERETILALASGADAYCIKGSQVTQIVDAIAAVQSGAMYLDEKVRHVVNQLKDSPHNQGEFNLSDREMEVLKLLVEGHSNGAIAEALFLSESTIKAHLRNIMTKFEVNDRVQVAVVALRSGLVQ